MMGTSWTTARPGSNPARDRRFGAGLPPGPRPAKPARPRPVASERAAATPVLAWFRRDLRVHDHPALLAAVRTGQPVQPVFVADPALLAGPNASANRNWFLHGALLALDDALRGLGVRLRVETGSPEAVLPALAAALGVRDVHASREYTPYGRGRDERASRALEAVGARLHLHSGVLVHEPDEVLGSSGQPLRLFTPFSRAWHRLPLRSVEGTPAAIRPVEGGAAAGGTPSRDRMWPTTGSGPAADVALLPAPGETAARLQLDAWLETGLEPYGTGRDTLAIDATSHLSAALHLGLLSSAEVATRVLERAADTARAERFLTQVAWRDFYAHALWHGPDPVRDPAVREREIGWRDDPEEIRAWRGGTTGYPIVDAGMRHLARSGWIPNRIRMVVASFLTNDLLADWRVGHREFLQALVDGDVASNAGNWQWAASTGLHARPYLRVFSPVRQGERFDPAGAYVRRWVPELRDVPDGYVHRPWAMEAARQTTSGCVIGSDYPRPIVDHDVARLRAQSAFSRAREQAQAATT